MDTLNHKIHIIAVGGCEEKGETLHLSTDISVFRNENV